MTTLLRAVAELRAPDPIEMDGYDGVSGASYDPFEAPLDLMSGEVCLSNTTVTRFVDTEGECAGYAEGCTPGSGPSEGCIRSSAFASPM